MQQPEQKNVEFTVTIMGKQFYVTNMGNEFIVTPMEKVVHQHNQQPAVQEGSGMQPKPTQSPPDAGAVEGAAVNPPKVGVAPAPVEAAGVEASPPPNPPLPPVEAAVDAGVDAAVAPKPTKGLVKVAAVVQACVEASKAGGAAEVVDAPKEVLAAPPKLKEDPIADEACAAQGAAGAPKRIMDDYVLSRGGIYLTRKQKSSMVEEEQAPSLPVYEDKREAKLHLLRKLRMLRFKERQRRKAFMLMKSKQFSTMDSGLKQDQESPCAQPVLGEDAEIEDEVIFSGGGEKVEEDKSHKRRSRRAKGKRKKSRRMRRQAAAKRRACHRKAAQLKRLSAQLKCENNVNEETKMPCEEAPVTVDEQPPATCPSQMADTVIDETEIRKSLTRMRSSPSMRLQASSKWRAHLRLAEKVKSVEGPVTVDEQPPATCPSPLSWSHNKAELIELIKERINQIEEKVGAVTVDEQPPATCPSPMSWSHNKAELVEQIKERIKQIEEKVEAERLIEEFTKRIKDILEEIKCAASGQAYSGETSSGPNEERIAKLEPIKEPSTNDSKASQENEAITQEIIEETLTAALRQVNSVNGEAITQDIIEELLNAAIGQANWGCWLTDDVDSTTETTEEAVEEAFEPETDIYISDSDEEQSEEEDFYYSDTDDEQSEEEEITQEIFEELLTASFGQANSGCCLTDNVDSTAESAEEALEEAFLPETNVDQKSHSVIGGNPNVILQEIHTTRDEEHGGRDGARAHIDDTPSLRGQQQPFEVNVTVRNGGPDINQFNNEQKTTEKELIKEEIEKLGDPHPSSDLKTFGNFAATRRNAMQMHHCSQRYRARSTEGRAEEIVQKMGQLFPQRCSGKGGNQGHRQRRRHSHHAGPSANMFEGPPGNMCGPIGGPPGNMCGPIGGPPGIMFDTMYGDPTWENASQPRLNLLVHRQPEKGTFKMSVDPKPFCTAMGISTEDCWYPERLALIEKYQIALSSKRQKDRGAYYMELKKRENLRGGVNGRQKEARIRQKESQRLLPEQMKSYIQLLEPEDNSSLETGSEVQSDPQLGTRHTVTADIHHPPTRTEYVDTSIESAEEAVEETVRETEEADTGNFKNLPCISRSGFNCRRAMVQSLLGAHPNFELSNGVNVFCAKPEPNEKLCFVHATVTALMNLDSIKHAASSRRGPIGDALTRFTHSSVETEKKELIEVLASLCGSSKELDRDGEDAAIFMQTLLCKLLFEGPVATAVFSQFVEELSTCICCGGDRKNQRYQVMGVNSNESLADDRRSKEGCINGKYCEDGKLVRTELLNKPDAIVQKLASRGASGSYKHREEIPYEIHNGLHHLKFCIVHIGKSPLAGHFITLLTNPFDRQECLLVDNGKISWLNRGDFEIFARHSYIIGYERVEPLTVPKLSSGQVFSRMSGAMTRTIRRDKALKSQTFLKGVKANIQFCLEAIDKSYSPQDAKKALSEMLQERTYRRSNGPLLTEEQEANTAARDLWEEIRDYNPKPWSVWKKFKSGFNLLGLDRDNMSRHIWSIERECKRYKIPDVECSFNEPLSLSESRVFGTGVEQKKGAKYSIIYHAQMADEDEDGKRLWKCNYCQAIRHKPEMMMHHKKGRCAVLTRKNKHFQITPRNIPRGYWWNDTTKVKIIRQHDRGNITRYTVIQGGEEFSFVIQTNSPTGYQYPTNHGTVTNFGKAWDGRGHSGVDNELLVAARECVYFKDEFDDDVTSQFPVWSLIGQLFSITERREDETGVNLNIIAHPAKDPKNRKLEKEIELIIVASEHEEGHTLKMILRRPGRKDEELTEFEELGFGKVEDPDPKDEILRSLTNCNVDLYVNKAHLPVSNQMSDDGDLERADGANADVGDKTNVDSGQNPSDIGVGECSYCKKGWTHVCPLDQSQSDPLGDCGTTQPGKCSDCKKGRTHVCPFDKSQSDPLGDCGTTRPTHSDERYQTNVVFKFTNQGELLCWVNTATQVLFHTMPNIGRYLSRALDQATDPTKTALPRMLLEIISKCDTCQDLNSLRDLLVAPPRERDSGPALRFFENLVYKLVDNAPASVVGFANEQERCEIVSQCSHEGCTEALLESSTIYKSGLFLVNHKPKDDGFSAQAAINRWISHKERLHNRTCGKGHSNMRKRNFKFHKKPDIFLVHAADGGSFDQQTSIDVQFKGTTYRAVAVIHHIPGGVGHHLCSLWDAAQKQWLLIDDYHSEASWKRLYHFDNKEKAFKVDEHNLFSKLGVVFYERQGREKSIVVQEFNRLNFHRMLTSGQQVFRARNIGRDRNGMERPGNECYAIQGIGFLLSCPHMHHLLRNWPLTNANPLELYLRALCYSPPNAICTNILQARRMVPQEPTKFEEDTQQDSMEFIESMLNTIRLRPTMNAHGEVASPVPTDILGYTEENRTVCTEAHCERDSVGRSEELVYRVDITEDSVNGCLRHQLETPTVLDNDEPCDICGVPNAIYQRTHNVSHVKKCIILQLKRFSAHGKINVPVKVDDTLCIGAFNGYVLTSTILHRGTTKNCGHYTGLIRDPATNTWVHTDDDKAQVIEERVAKEMLRKEGYILFYSKPDSFPVALKGEHTNQETVRERRRVQSRRIPKQMKSSSTREQISSFKTDDSTTPINLPKLPHKSYLKTFKVHSPSEQELEARMVPNPNDINQPILDPNDELAIKLRAFFGHNNFRSVEQLEATKAVIAAHRDVLVIMSTGTIYF